jgi:hypothetical protein
MQRPSVLKWPNDLLCDGNKLAGVLLEMATEGDRIGWPHDHRGDLGLPRQPLALLADLAPLDSLRDRPAHRAEALFSARDELDEGELERALVRVEETLRGLR